MTVGEYLLENYSSDELDQFQAQLLFRMQKNRLVDYPERAPVGPVMPEQESFIGAVVEREAAIV